MATVCRHINAWKRSKGLPDEAIGKASVMEGVVGGLAQLARAPALQAGGHRFESDILHREGVRMLTIRLKADVQHADRSVSIRYPPQGVNRQRASRQRAIDKRHKTTDKKSWLDF